MEIWVLILILILFTVLEFIAAFGFNIKLKMLNKKKYTKAAALGAVSTCLFMMMTLLTPLVAGETSVWFIFIGGLFMALGNVAAALSLRPFEKWYDKKQTKKGEV